LWYREGYTQKSSSNITMISSILSVLLVLSGIAIVAMVLLHAPKGDGLAAIGGQGQLFSSQKSAEKNLDRATWGAIIVFLSISAVLSSGLLKQPPQASAPAPTSPTAPISLPSSVPAPTPAGK
jgi:preprotein translocase subunit SecG